MPSSLSRRLSANRLPIAVSAALGLILLAAVMLAAHVWRTLRAALETHIGPVLILDATGEVVYGNERRRLGRWSNGNARRFSMPFARRDGGEPRPAVGSACRARRCGDASDATR